MTQIPHGPDNLYCPLHRAKMAKVCHTCPLWVQLRGTDKNTGHFVDEWMCSLTALPKLLVENADMARQAGAATETLRNELVRVSANTLSAAETFQAVQVARKPNLIDVTPQGST